MHPSCSMAERIDVSQSKGRLVQASYKIPSNKEIKINPHLAALLRVTPGETLSFQMSEQGRVTLTGRKNLLQLAQEQNQRTLTYTLGNERTLHLDQQLLDTLRIQEGDRILFSVSEQQEVTVTGVRRGVPQAITQQAVFSKEAVTQPALFDMPGIPLPSGRTRKRRTR